ncbi:hypothetical protein N8198_01540 [Gammaproteobacteria bacterium]|nr:hypothetical protein [Gammaproteobacteria bacterium]
MERFDCFVAASKPGDGHARELDGSEIGDALSFRRQVAQLQKD